MFGALALAVRQLGDPPILRVFLKSLALTLLVFAGLGLGLWAGARWLVRWVGWDETTATLAGLAAVLGAIALGWLLFRVVAVAVIGLFGDEVVEAVERRHYPSALAAARPVPLAQSLAMGLGSAGRTIGVNLLLAPLYLLLLVTGVGTAVAFFLVNGWLLGRDLADRVAARHLPRTGLSDWRAGSRGGRLVLGLAVTGLLVVPLLNLAAPVIGAAMATHWFHRRGRA